VADFSVGIQGLNELTSLERDVTNAGHNLQSGQFDAFLQAAGIHFYDTVMAQFETMGSAQGTPFAALNEDYAAAKGNGSFPGQTHISEEPDLQLTEAYIQSWGWDFIDADSVKIFSQLESTIHYWHEFGVPNRHGQLPERPVLVVTDKDLEFLDQEFLKLIDTKVVIPLVGGGK